MIKIIANVSENNVIGKDGELASYYKEDMNLFKKLTTNSIVIMGKNTFASLKYKPLPNRINVVISKTLADHEGIIIFKSLKKAIKKYPDSWLIGGAGIYEEGMKHADGLYITKSPDIITGDNLVYFPEITSNFQLISSQVFENDSRLTLNKYAKISNKTSNN